MLRSLVIAALAVAAVAVPLDRHGARHRAKTHEEKTGMFLYEQQGGCAEPGHRLGFPSVAGCNALVIEAENGMLCGFHLLGGDRPGAIQRKYTEAFVPFVKLKFGDSAIKAIHSATHFGGRYGDQARASGWKTEMVVWARAFEFDGDVKGYDVAFTGANTQESTYIQFEHKHGAVVFETTKWENIAELDKDEDKSTMTDRVCTSTRGGTGDKPLQYLCPKVGKLDLPPLTDEQLSCKGEYGLKELNTKGDSETVTTLVGDSLDPAAVPPVVSGDDEPKHSKWPKLKWPRMLTPPFLRKQ